MTSFLGEKEGEGAGFRLGENGRVSRWNIGALKEMASVGHAMSQFSQAVSTL